MVRDSNEGHTEQHERSPGLRPAMLGSMKARPRAASADITLASTSSIHGAEYVQQTNVRHQHIDEPRLTSRSGVRTETRKVIGRLA